MIKDFKTADFDSVIASESPVLVDFWAPWCVHCRTLHPILEQFAASRSDITVGRVNVDEEPELAQKYQIQSIPAVLVFQNGQAVARKISPQDEEELEEMLS